MYEEVCYKAIAVDTGYEWEVEFGLLAIVIGVNKYMELTNKVYTNTTEPPSYNDLINQGTSDYYQDKKSAEHGVLREEWETYIGRKEEISGNIRDALDLTYYEQLKAKTVGYKKVKIFEYLKYLNKKLV